MTRHPPDATVQIYEDPRGAEAIAAQCAALMAVRGLVALTLTAPYGTAIMRWNKPWENRGWLPPKKLWKQRIGIHQSLLPLLRDGSISKGAIGEGIVDSFNSIIDDGLLDGIVDAHGRPVTPDLAVAQLRLDSGMLIGTTVLADVVSVANDGTHAISLWAKPNERVKFNPWMVPGSFAYQLVEPQFLENPIELSGLQKFWTVDERRLPRTPRRGMA